jgi:hypothetical protein
MFLRRIAFMDRMMKTHSLTFLLDQGKGNSVVLKERKTRYCTLIISQEYPGFTRVPWCCDKLPCMLPGTIKNYKHW